MLTPLKRVLRCEIGAAVLEYALLAALLALVVLTAAHTLDDVAALYPGRRERTPPSSDSKSRHASSPLRKDR